MSALAFLGGLGAGALAQGERNKDRERQAKQDERLDRQEERQAKLDAQAKQLHDENIATIKRANDNRQADIEAASPVVPKEFATVDLAQGEMGPSPVAPKLGGFAVGKDAYLDKAQANKVAEQQSTPEATQARRIQTLRTTGRNAEADQLESTIKQGKAADMQLRAGERAETDAKLKEANAVWNTSLADSVKKHGNVHKGLTAIMSESEIDGVTGSKFTVAPSKDGKLIQWVRTDQDGKQSVFKTYPTGPEGDMMALQDSMRIPPEKQLEFMQERQARAAAQAKAAQEAELHAARIKLMGAQGLHYARAGAASKAGAAPASFDPLATVDFKDAQAKATAQAAKEAEAAEASGNPWTAKQQGMRATELKQALLSAERDFNVNQHVARAAGAALRAAASNPAVYVELFNSAVEDGISVEQLAAMGFKPPATPAKPVAQVAAPKKPMSAADVANLIRSQQIRQAVAGQ